MAKETYIVIALFNFDLGFPIFEELIGVTDSSRDAFSLVDNYDCEKIIKAGNAEMIVSEIVDHRRKEFEINSCGAKALYSEDRVYDYASDPSERYGRVKVTLTIFMK